MSVIKRLIDDQFVPQTGLLVNLRLVDSSSTLTQAILAKQGPDCALIVPSQTPINLAMRDALVELSSLEGFQETRGWFYDSAFIPYIFQDGVYAMPETQVFWMIFYRKDILAGMGLEPPDTWEDFYKAVSVIMKNNMQIGVPENQQIFELSLIHIFMWTICARVFTCCMWTPPRIRIFRGPCRWIWCWTARYG